MPGKDGTGPLGQGPGTGRGRGACGRGLGFGKGFGRGFGCNEPVELSKEEQKKMLEAEKAAIDKRLKELE